MEWVIQNWDNIALIVTSIVTAASIVVRLTPTKRDDEALGKVMRILNFIAINKKPK